MNSSSGEQKPQKSALSSSELQKYAGSYSMTAPSADGPKRTITLTLNSDQTFTMKFSYEAKGEIPPFEGTWTLNGDQVEAIVTKPAGMEDRYVFTLKNDTLTAVEYNRSEYGSQGLSLRKQ